MSPGDLSEARDALGMSVTEFADWLGLSRDHGRTAIREMESGKREISGPVARAIRLAMASQKLLEHCEILPLEAEPSIRRLVTELGQV